MSGFAGFNGSLEFKEDIIKKMLDKIAHRGQDEEVFLSNDSITLGYRHLNNSEYVIYNDDATIFIVYDGKLYNNHQLRNGLEKDGYFFKTNSDAEILIHLYNKKNIDMVNDLKGMFSFCIYDSIKDEFYAVRDFFGIKPLYYTILNDNIIFASEIKSILEYPIKKELNVEALENYLSFQYSVLNETFFKNVYKLSAGHYLKFKDGNLSITKYYDPIFEETPKTTENSSLQSSIKLLSKELKNSTVSHNIQNTEEENNNKIGIILSNDINSNYISIMNPTYDTFSVSFDYNENNHIDEINDFCKNFEIRNSYKSIKKTDYIDTLPKVLYHLDEPTGDLSIITTYLSCNFAKNKVDTVLLGDGLDEILAGHNIYNEPFHISFLTALPKKLRKFLANFVNTIPFSFTGKSVINRAYLDIEERFIGSTYIFSKDEREKILKNPINAKDPTQVVKPFFDTVKNLDDVSKMQYIDIKLALSENILPKIDKLSTANGLEARLPFVDKDLFQVVRKIPPDYRTNKQATKYIFRMVAKEYLPQDICNRENIPFKLILKDWLREDTFYNRIKLAFNSETAQKYFNVEEILQLLENHREGKEEFTRKIWTIYTFLVWYEQFFD